MSISGLFAIAISVQGKKQNSLFERIVSKKRYSGKDKFKRMAK